MLEEAFKILAEYVILISECIGLIVLVAAAIKSMIALFRHQPETHAALTLAKGIALALEFMMGGEVLRTAITHEIKDLIALGIIVALRVALTLLIHWEIKIHEEIKEDEHV